MRRFDLPGRSLAVAADGMAATSHAIATVTALDILRRGGNAVDAAVAACAVQNVVEPGSVGIGGDCFALIAPRGSGDIIAFNGSGRAPAAATAAWYREAGIGSIERQSPHAVTVPGAVDGWARILADHGTMPLADVLAPAVHYARDGYAVTPRVAYDWSLAEPVLAGDPASRRIFLAQGRAPAMGDRHRQPELATTLERIGRDGPAAFYTGAVAEDLVGLLRSLGGLHTLDDFAEVRGSYVTPIRTSFRGYDVVESPPNGQGIIALMILNILSRFEGRGDPLAIDRLHIEIEAARLAYGIRDAYLADTDHHAMPAEWMLSQSLADDLAGRIDLRRALPPAHFKPPTEHSDTVQIVVVDRDRTAISLISSIFNSFGSGLTGPRSGVLLHNRGQSFVLDPDHPNTIAPGKRPLHTIIPGMLVKDGRCIMPFGVMGGHYQAMGHAHLVSKRLDYGLDLQSAIDLPRLFPRPGHAEVELEAPLYEAAGPDLSRRGFAIARPATPIGGAQAIWIDWERGTLQGGSDPRKDGCALGF